MRLIPGNVGAEEGTRTPTPLRVRGPEPRASANSATSARDTNPAISAGSAASLSLAKPAFCVKSSATSRSANHFFFKASNSSSVRGQSEPSSRDRLRSASTFPPVWHLRTVVGLVVGIANPLHLITASRTRQIEPPMHRHLRPEGRHLLRKALSRLGSKSIHPYRHRRACRRKQPLPLFRFQLVRLRDWRKLRRMQNLVGIRIPYPADQARIGQRALQSAILRSQCRAKSIQVRLKYLHSARIHRIAAPPRREPHISDARRFEPASVSTRDPFGKSNAASAFRPASLAPAAFQCSRPAIIRCNTSQISSSNPIAIRFPIRRNSRTVLPSAALSGGSTLRSKNTEPSRTCSSVCPTMRSSSAVMYAEMSGSSGMCTRLRAAAGLTQVQHLFGDPLEPTHCRIVLSISRVFPTHAATANSEPGAAVSTGHSVSQSTSST